MVDAIPEGYATITPSLMMKDCAKAIETYKKALGAKEISRMETGPGGKIMHAVLEIGNSRIFMSDEFPGCPTPQNSSFYLYVPDVDAAISKAKEAGFKETMPAEDMFWGDRLGAITDEYGVQWSIATHTKDVSEAELEKGREEFMAKMKQSGSKAA